MATAAVERRVEVLIDACRSAAGSVELRDAALARLRRVVAFDAAFFATVDPTTMLFTSAVADEPLGTATSLFLDNEYGDGDVNKFVALAAGDPVRSLDQATDGDWTASRRYRDIMAPLALGDELRAALVVGGRCWGVLCLHREDGSRGFDTADIGVLRRVVPHFADGLRRTVFVERTVAAPATVPTGPGLVVLDANLGIVSANPPGEYWLAELSDEPSRRAQGLPVAVHAVAARLAASDDADPAAAARTRVRTTAGPWVVVHGSQLHGPQGAQIAIVFEPAQRRELSSLILDAHGVTPAQSRVAALVLQGRSTRQIVNELCISASTVQEHLRAVFDKFGIGSRRELVAVLLGGAHQ